MYFFKNRIDRISNVEALLHPRITSVKNEQVLNASTSFVRRAIETTLFFRNHRLCRFYFASGTK